MKSMKKLMALLLVVIMTLALGTTAFAASSEEDQTGSITITNTDAFDPTGTYTAYKIFDVTYADGTKTEPYSYTISSTSPWLATVQTYFDTVAAASDSTVLVVTPKDGYDAATFAAALKTAYDAMTTKPTGTTLAGEGNEELALGYWFVTTTTGSLCNLTTTHPDAEIHDKNEPTPFDKDETSVTITGSVQVGDVVPYEITGKVPSTVGYSEYTYQVGDTISGAIFQKDVAVKFGTTTITPSASELVYDEGNGFTLTFDMVDYQEYVDEPISITYTAIVNTSSLTAGEVKNTATLKHTHTPTDVTDLKEEPDVEVILKTFTIDLSKVAEDGSSPLADAQFVLQNSEGKYYTLVYGVNKIDGKGNDVSTKDEVVWVDDVKDAMVVITDATGKGNMEFAGLEAGTYELIETKAPYGYNLPKDPFEVKIIEGEERVVTETTDLITKEYTYTATVKGPYDDEAKDADINDISYVATTIMNKSGVLLPETGGFGTTMLIALGSVLFTATAIVLVTKKRLYNEG